MPDKANPNYLLRVLPYIKPYKLLFTMGLLITMLTAVVNPIRPYLLKLTIDEHIIKNLNVGIVEQILLVVVGILLVESILKFFQNYLTSALGQSVVFDLRKDLFKHIQKQRMQYFDTTPVGTLQTRVVGDIENIASIFSEGLIVIIGDIIQLTAIIGVMFYMNWILACIALSTVPILFVATVLFKNGIKKTFDAVRNQVAKLNTFVQEHLTGMKIVQVFNREEKELEVFKKINADYKKANINAIWYYSLFFPVVEILASVSVGLLIWVGGRYAINMDANQVTPGLITAFIMYINMLFKPMRELADRFNTLQMGVVCSERVFKILDTNTSIPEPVSDIPLPTEIKGELTFQDVWLAYREDEWVLKGISINIKKGETIALVGATGSGKTSIVNLLNRFYDFQKGSILLDGISIKEYPAETLRKHIAVVLQDVFLFSDTITNNITLNDESYTHAQIVEAAKAIGAHEFIMALPGGYDFNVMERGGLLSAGQRQLLSFMRAFIYNPEILVLDEATANIDTESEVLIQKATDAITANRTSIIIAHRLATIQKASRIVVLDKGKIVEIGTHEELLQLPKGYYTKLYNYQFQVV